MRTSAGVTFCARAKLVSAIAAVNTVAMSGLIDLLCQFEPFGNSIRGLHSGWSPASVENLGTWGIQTHRHAQHAAGR